MAAVLELPRLSETCEHALSLTQDYHGPAAKCPLHGDQTPAERLDEWLLAMPRPSLDVERHVYSLGERVRPSVTEILVGTGIVDERWFTEYGRWRGSAVHQVTWFDDEGDLDVDSVVDTEAFTRREVLGHLEGWRKFRRVTGFAPKAIERSVCHPTLGYAGTPDRVGVLGDGRLCLPDLK